MDDEAETYKLWRVRKTIMQVRMHGMERFQILLSLSVCNEIARKNFAEVDF